MEIIIYYINYIYFYFIYIFKYVSLIIYMPKKEETEKITRIAIVNADRCKPKKCNLECKRICPVNAQGKQCIVVNSGDSIMQLAENLCIGCALCTKRCPFQAIQIINLPSNLDKETVHRYGKNAFKLHRLPLPRPGKILGLLGANGTGKSTALQILKGNIKPNLGDWENKPMWDDIIKYYRGSEHQAYFSKLIEGKIKAIMKPQLVEQLKRTNKTVESLINDDTITKDTRYYIETLELDHLLKREVSQLSGGELQRLAIAMVCVHEYEVYMFDEPSSYLDVKQRLVAANVIRGLVKLDNYIITVEHDLAVVDYMSDNISVLYGQPGVFGVVTFPYGTREGINIFLDGFISTENMKFRDEGLTFRIVDNIEISHKRHSIAKYPVLTKKMGSFTLNVAASEFTDSEIIVLMGQNGCGKTTLIRMLCGLLKSDNGNTVPQMAISYKPQTISPKFEGNVKDLLQTKIPSSFVHQMFQIDVIKALKIPELYDKEVKKLSGGELQRVAITIALGTPAQVYFLDEPSAYLDSDQRIIVSKVIKRFILHAKKTAFVVEHDFIMATYIADRIIVYEGTPGVQCTALEPSTVVEGMNKFLEQISISFRRDPSNYRPRINKLGSVKDRLQKETGNYFYMADFIISNDGEKIAMNDDED